MLHRISAILSLVLLIVFPIHAEDSKQTLELGMKSFIQIVQENDPEFMDIIEERARTKFHEDLHLPSTATQINLGGEYGLEKGQDSPVPSLNSSIERSLRTTGTDLSVSYSLDKQTDMDERTLQVRVEQPLLRNSFGSNTRLHQSTLQKENELLRLEVAEAHEEYIYQRLSQYLDLRLTYLNYQASKALYNDSVRLQENISERERNNIATELDVNKIRLQTIDREENRLDLETELETQMQELLPFIGRDDVERIIPSKKEEWIEKEMGLSKPVENLIGKTRGLKIHRLLKEIAKRQIDLAKEELKPDANLILGYNRNRSEQFGNVSRQNEGIIGFSLNIPFLPSQHQAEVQAAQLDERRVQFQFSSFQIARQSEIQALKKKVIKQKERVELSEQKWQLSQRVVDRETQRYQNGRVDLETLIESEQALAQNRFNYLSNQVTLTRYVLQWLNTTDQLIVEGVALNL